MINNPVIYISSMNSLQIITSISGETREGKVFEIFKFINKFADKCYFSLLILNCFTVFHL